MKEIVNVINRVMPYENLDAMGIGLIDFNNGRFKAFEVTRDSDQKLHFTADPLLYFDLASLTKPLTNSLSYFLHPKSFDDKTLLCLNHRGGLPAWGLLGHDDWRQQILGYPIQEGQTLYSDFSALRVLLELQGKGIDVKQSCSSVWDRETLFWTDVQAYLPKPQYGFKNGQPNVGQVHDPNAYVIKDFCSHAGLFSTIDGLCRTLLSYEEQTRFIAQVQANLKTHSQRFAFGWDRVENPDATLAGKGCGPDTFGHLGFTGTSIWIDPDKRRGHVILSNATKLYWYDKQGLNDMRRAIGEAFWKMDEI